MHPLTHSLLLKHRAALSREGRGQMRHDRARGLIVTSHHLELPNNKTTSERCQQFHHSDANSFPKPWIGPATLPRRMELQIIAFIQVTTVVSRSCSSSSMLWMLPQPPQGM